jgi:hypothetical protein
VLYYHQYDLALALVELFPEIGLKKSMFPNKTSPNCMLSCSHILSFNSTLIIDTAWHAPGARRKFFESYAKRKGFDPLIPENWYNQAHIRLLGQVFSMEDKET